MHIKELAELDKIEHPEAARFSSEKQQEKGKQRQSKKIENQPSARSVDDHTNEEKSVTEGCSLGVAVSGQMAEFAD